MSSERGFSEIVKIWGEFRKASSKGIDSLVIKVKDKLGQEYVACKIQPALDGGEENVSQTKGIIYYFQEGRQLGLPTVWDLIENTSL